jgi:hypothetical protein
MLSLSISYWDIIKFPYFVETTRRGDKGVSERRPKHGVTLSSKANNFPFFRYFHSGVSNLLPCALHVTVIYMSSIHTYRHCNRHSCVTTLSDDPLQLSKTALTRFWIFPRYKPPPKQVESKGTNFHDLLGITYRSKKSPPKKKKLKFALKIAAHKVCPRFNNLYLSSIPWHI